MRDLTKNEQIKLLNYARKIIADSLSIENKIYVSEFNEDIFEEKCGAFVTLHITGALRGCIGYIKGVKNIPDTISDMAKSAAFNDPRFNPLSKNEYNQIDIEISVLSPIEEVDDISNIKVGRDGIIISRGYNSGLLLPQVPVEQKWDRDTFIEHTCFKAGLPGDAWRDKDTKIEKFSAQVFGEIKLDLINK
jgi:AmmeMemoRadiSam system protein A